MRQAVHVAVVVFIGIVVVCAAMVYAAVLLDPHWVSKDGQRFLCAAQYIGQYGEPQERMRETRIIVLSDGTLEVSQKRMRRRRTSLWRLVGKLPDPPRNKVVYVLEERGEPRNNAAALAVRLPEKSRAVTTLDAVLERKTR